MGITAVPGTNPTDVINANTLSAVTVGVTHATNLRGTETAFLTLTDGSSTVTSATITVPGGGGAGTFGGLNCSSLLDGGINLSMTVIDEAGNATVSAPVALTKDTVAPAPPTMAHVRNAGTNPIDVINAASVGTVGVDVTFGSGSVASDTATVTISDGVNPDLSVGTGAASAGAGTLTFGTVNAAGLNEGPIALSITVTDTNLNAVTTAGMTAAKDTQAPAAPTSAVISATSSNPTNFINAASEAAVQVDVMLPASYGVLVLEGRFPCAIIQLKGAEGEPELGYLLSDFENKQENVVVLIWQNEKQGYLEVIYDRADVKGVLLMPCAKRSIIHR